MRFQEFDREKRLRIGRIHGRFPSRQLEPAFVRCAAAKAPVRLAFAAEGNRGGVLPWLGTNLQVGTSFAGPEAVGSEAEVE